MSDRKYRQPGYMDRGEEKPKQTPERPARKDNTFGPRPLQMALLQAQGVQTRDEAQLANARLLLIPASSETRGHGTTGNSNLWKADFAKFIAAVPHPAM